MRGKKFLLFLLALVLLTACGNKETKKEDKTKDGDSAQTQALEGENKSKEEQTLKAGEEWLVDGQWKLVINSVKVLTGRNESSKKKPKQVVCIDYSYENIGCTEEIDGVYFSPESVIDGEGEMAYSYPAVEELNYPQSTPVGAKMKNAQEAYGLNNESDKITVIFGYAVNIDGRVYHYRATMEAKVEK